MLLRLLFVSLFLPCVTIAQNKKRVLLVSIDGFRPDFYKNENWNAPFLNRLKSNGVYADGVSSVFPSVTYPSHTSIVTGKTPGVHGVYYNAPYPSKKGAWYWEASYIKVPTIWDAVKTAGLTSGAVMWPVTVGAPITYNFPVKRADDDEKTDQLSVTQPFVTPANLLSQMQPAVGVLTANSFNYDNIDITIGKMAAYIIKTYQPDLMAVHFIGLDHAQHEAGRDARTVQQSLAIIDSMLSVVVTAYHAKGIKDKPDIIITGDHGFVSVKQTISPNALLYEEGLITDKDWKARFHTTGGSAFLYLKTPGDEETLNKVKQIFAQLAPDQRRHFNLIDRAGLDQLGANAEIPLAIAADNLSALNNSTELPLIKTEKKITGSHGHDPRMPELYTGFIAQGPSFKTAASLSHLSLTDMSALISEILKLSFNKVDADLKTKVFK